MLKNIILVAVGGGLGCVLRFLANIGAGKMNTKPFYATFLVNIIGCLILGYLIGYFQKNENDSLKLLLTTGFCGGFTTFSTFSTENLSLIQEGNYTTALLYTLGSLIIGILFAGFGLYLAK